MRTWSGEKSYNPPQGRKRSLDESLRCGRRGRGTMPLVTCDDARSWAKAIRHEVLERRMPPWAPVKGVGEFLDDPSLKSTCWQVGRKAGH
jgi:hypothetical protein